MGEHQCSQAGHAHFHQAHKHMLKLDSSDYAHIWESPVPLPMTMPIEHSINHHLTHAHMNSDGARPHSEAVFKEAAHTLDIIRDSLCDNCEHSETLPRVKRKDAKSGYSYETPRYFVLERDMMMNEGGVPTADHCGHDHHHHHEHAQTLPLKQPHRGDTPMSPVAMCTERERPELRSFKQ